MWFAVFTILLTVQFTAGVSDVEVIGVSEDRLARLGTNEFEEAYKCELETNRGKKYEFQPGEIIGDNIKSIHRFTCAVDIYSILLEDLGQWKLTTHFKEHDRPSVTHKFKLYRRQKTKVVPDEITIFKGYYIFAKLDIDFKNITNCTVTLPTDSYLDKRDLLNVRAKNLQRFGQCGFRALTNKSSNGIWRLEAIDDDKFIYEGSVSVRVYESTEESERMNVIVLERGKEGTVHLTVDTKITFCQLEGPNGVRSPIFPETCEYKVSVVTTRYEGIWTARYAVTGNPVPIVRRFRVITRDSRTIGGNVTLTENNEIQLRCHVHDLTITKYRFCQFTRPDGYMLNLSPGVGTDSYSAFNTSAKSDFASSRNFYCGLIIHQPKQYDYGAWKCGLGSYYKQYDGLILNVDPPVTTANGKQDVDREIHIVADNVYVKRNDSFQLKCNVDAALDYCWFRSPNGTSYSVSRDQAQSPTSLPYAGFGLGFGECVAIINRAYSTDDGAWTCNVGVVDGPEKSKTFHVHVTESYIIPANSELLANYEDSITLRCNLLPNLTDNTIRYCRWIRPDGHGIYNSLNHRYRTNNTDTQCILTIASDCGEKDIGRWTCVAGLSGIADDEEWASITVRSQSVTSQLLIGVAIIATMLFAAVLCALSFIHIHQKRLAPMKDPPAYSPEKSPPQNFVKA